MIWVQEIIWDVTLKKTLRHLPLFLEVLWVEAALCWLSLTCLLWPLRCSRPMGSQTLPPVWRTDPPLLPCRFPLAYQT